MKLTIQPLRAEGRVLVPVSQPHRIESDECTIHWALRESGYALHRESAKLTRIVSSESPVFCVAHQAGPLLYGVWLGWGGDLA